MNGVRCRLFRLAVSFRTFGPKAGACKIRYRITPASFDLNDSVYASAMEASNRQLIVL